jgi:hypothetical protein
MNMRSKTSRARSAAVLSTALTLAIVALPSDAVQRTFVASSGLDANPCSLTAPCRSFAAALAHTDANGEIIVIDSAGYGSVTIDKSVALIAAPGVYAGITAANSANGVTVNGAGIDVTLRGLAINGQGGGRGIFVASAAHVYIDRCDVSNFNAEGLYVNAAGVEVRVRDSTFQTNFGAGVNMVLGQLTMIGSRVFGNGGGGVRAVATLTSIVRSGILANGGDGIFTDSGGATNAGVTLTDDVIADNTFSGVNMGANIGVGSLVAVRNTIVDNGPVCSNCAGVVSFAALNVTVNAAVAGNVIARNGAYGLHALSFGKIYSVGDNTVIDNKTGDVVGSTALLPTY